MLQQGAALQRIPHRIWFTATRHASSPALASSRLAPTFRPSSETSEGILSSRSRTYIPTSYSNAGTGEQSQRASSGSTQSVLASRTSGGTRVETRRYPPRLNSLVAMASLDADPISESAEGMRRRRADQLKIGVVGAGVAGLVAATRLARLGCHVEVFDLGRGPGGRMSQRREKLLGDPAAPKEEGAASLGPSTGVEPATSGAVELRFDHGAQYFSSGSTEVSDFLKPWIARGHVAEWQGAFGTLDATTHHFEPAPSDPSKKRYVGVPGMNSLCQLLAASPGVKTVFSTHVAAINWLEATMQWEMRGAGDGQPLLGHFDAVIIAAAYRTFRVAVSVPASMEQSDSELRALMQGTTEVPAEPCFALMLALPQSASPAIPFDAAKVSGSPTLSWIARDSSKPGRGQPGGGATPADVSSDVSGEGGVECWVVHSTAEYARDVMSRAPPGRPSPELLQSVASDMLGAFRGLLLKGANGVEIPEPLFYKVHRWGGAFPSEARAPEGKNFLTGGTLPLAACGDFCLSPRVESAIDSALAASDWLAAKLLPESPKL